MDFEDGSTEARLAQAGATSAKADLPTDAIFRRHGPPVLTIVTRGGDFDRSPGRYDANVVVDAVPLAAGPRTAV